MHNRWYDKHARLAGFLEQFRTMEVKDRDTLIQEIMKIVKKHDGAAFEEFVMDFPLDIERRRWYDNDPYLWLIFNGLSYVDNECLAKVTDYLASTLPLNNGGARAHE